MPLEADPVALKQMRERMQRACSQRRVPSPEAFLRSELEQARKLRGWTNPALTETAVMLEAAATALARELGLTIRLADRAASEPAPAATAALAQLDSGAPPCPSCSSRETFVDDQVDAMAEYTCMTCGHQWEQATD